MWEKTKAFVSEHPWGTAGIIFVVGLLFLWLFLPRKASASGGSDLSPYYNAQAASVVSGAQVYEAQIAANAATANHTTDANAAIALGAQQADVMNQQTAAALEIGREQIDATTSSAAFSTLAALSLASYEAELGGIASYNRDATDLAIALGTPNTGASLNPALPNSPPPISFFPSFSQGTGTQNPTSPFAAFRSLLFGTPSSAIVTDPTTGALTAVTPTQTLSPTLPLLTKAA